jgi:hypothetical protein
LDVASWFATLAQTKEKTHPRLRDLAPPVPDELRAAWQAAAEACMA